LDSLVRVRSVNDNILKLALDSALARENLKWEQARVYGESLDSMMQLFLQQKKTTAPVATLIIKELFAATVELPVENVGDRYFQQRILCNGTISFDSSGMTTKSFSVKMFGTFTQRAPALISPKSESAVGFWDSTAKPILVTVGAVAVIALFFLIRG
jgi:hypothetical protein